MRGLEVGGLALVINARTNYGKQRLVGRTVKLLERLTTDGHCQTLGKDFHLTVNCWLVEVDSTFVNPEITVRNIPPGLCVCAEKFLLPIQPDENLVEDFKNEQFEEMTCSEFLDKVKSKLL